MEMLNGVESEGKVIGDKCTAKFIVNSGISVNRNMEFCN